MTEKKPVYKKVWFWVVIVFVIGAIGTAGDKENKDEVTTEVTAHVTTQNTVEVTTQNAVEVPTQNTIETTTQSVVEATSEQTAEPTMGQKNAKRSAENYINFMGFSRQGLIDQLKFDGYTQEEAEYGADNCGADWNQMAVKSAQSYISFMSFSRQGLIDQLKFDGYTQDEAEYAVTQLGY